MASHLEGRIQNECARALEWLGALVWRLNSGAVITRDRRRVQLCPPGTPDLQGILPSGRLVLVEVKTPTGRLSAAQQLMHQELRARGILVVVAHSADELLRALGVDLPDQPTLFEAPG